MTESGRRARKKAQTRKAIGDAALRLFLERGYDRVSVREIADAADVSLSTLFNYFPTKESLAFDESEAIGSALTATVRDCAPHEVVGALRAFIVKWATEVASYPHAAEFTDMIARTPALGAYGRRIWLQHEEALTRALADAVGAVDGDVLCRTLARGPLEGVIRRSGTAVPVATI
ncbi:TetR/AcrR family transcriptional regulator [Actinoplanes sp. N902-109]|uniref:TetR/AcrR family transcriptional regulator n=1 Tax=Actinoplanes sp. (strain N902-109) TaxID=649831 RepID=UPI0003294E16|nr:TetR/AcrR family transcriptional regulator [Actinoplanes sp. N902-109]AGL17935.1 TetR family transcriptional regulator [Actinoplanes sp. N902-109]